MPIPKWLGRCDIMVVVQVVGFWWVVRYMGWVCEWLLVMFEFGHVAISIVLTIGVWLGFGSVVADSA